MTSSPGRSASGVNALNCLLGCVMVYSSLFGIGNLIFGAWAAGIALLLLAAISGYLVFWNLARRGWHSLSGATPASAPVVGRSAGEHAQ